MRGKWILLAGVTILLAIAGGAISLWRQNSKPRVAPTPTKSTAPTSVATFTGNEVSLQGKIQAQKVVAVAAPIDGTIDVFLAEVGQDVAEGQPLARIKNAKLEGSMEAINSELERAQMRVTNTEGEIIASRLEASRARADASRARSELDAAEKAFNRQKMLYKEGATPRLVYEKSERDYKSAKEDFESKEAVANQSEDRLDGLNKQLDTFKRMLDDKKQGMEQAQADVAAGEVRSPVDGIVVGRRGQPGDAINPSVTDFFQIAATMAAMEVVLQPDPGVLARVKAGQRVSIHIAEMPGEEIAGAVREIKDGQVIVEFISPTTTIRPGLTAQVKILLTETGAK